MRFRLRFAVCASLGHGAWPAEFQFARAVAPLRPACWLAESDRSRFSTSKGCTRGSGFLPVDLTSFFTGDYKCVTRHCYSESDIDLA